MESKEVGVGIDCGSRGSPHGETESALAAIWCKILALDSVSRDDNFFELGGQSPAAMGVLTKVTERFDVALPFTAIFQYPTVREMAELVEGLRNAPGSPSGGDEVAP